MHLTVKLSVEFWENLKMKNNTDDCGNEIIELMISGMKIKILLVKNPIIKDQHRIKISGCLRKNINNIKYILKY